MKTLIKKTLHALPYIGSLKKELDIYKTQVPPGHFYSPLVSVQDLQSRETEIFHHKPRELVGIELRENEQLALLKELAKNYSTIPFKDEKFKELRYFFKNDQYTYSDAIFLNLMIRHFKPQRIIEIGSGYSSAVMLDTNELFFDNKIHLTFIEPYPDRLFSILKERDKQSCQIHVSDLQKIDLKIFDELNSGDILFVDSTHVSKTGSDVNKIIFEILPRLKKGVLIHFHDIFYPFEYPKEWVLGWKGFGWNEDYILRAFLMYNPSFKIIMFNTFLEQFHRDWFQTHMPRCLLNEGGSLWIEKN